MGYNFDEYFRKFLKLFKQILNDPNSDHPLKHIFKNADLDRLAENPPSMEDISKFMQYFFQDPNFNPFTQGGQIFNKYAPQSHGSKPLPKKPTDTKATDANLIIDSFEFGDEIHVLVGTNRTDLEFKTGVKKGDRSKALIIRNKKGNALKIVQLPHEIDNKSKQVSYQNGTYEIIYKKRS